MTEPAPPSAGLPVRAEIVVDLGAIRHNVRRLRELVTDEANAPQLMVVVKANAYGHGLEQVARAAREAGADWLGVATLDEALEVRAAGDAGRLLCWLAVPGEDFAPAIAADVDVSAYSVAQLAEVTAAARRVGRTARVQLKVDTGLSRGGALAADWPDLVAAAREAEVAGDIIVTGIWSHPACFDEPDHPANDRQEAAFRAALDVADQEGLEPEVRHLANSAGGVLRPSARFDLVRFGIATYGLTPAPGVASSRELGLRPAMTLTARTVMTKVVEAGEGISYGHTFVADRRRQVALVPLGYADGIPRNAGSVAEVGLAGARGRILGRVCMDQVVVDAPDAAPGDEVTIFGTGDQGEPTAQEWADWCGTISYEIVTRAGGRARRRWVG